MGMAALKHLGVSNILYMQKRKKYIPFTLQEGLSTAVIGYIQPWDFSTTGAS